MLIGIIGENCSGKSTLAACIRDGASGDAAALCKQLMNRT